MIYYSCILTSCEAPLSWPVSVQLSYDVYDSCIFNICSENVVHRRNLYAWVHARQFYPSSQDRSNSSCSEQL